MSKERELQCWLRLREGASIPRSQVPGGVRNGQAFAQLYAAEIITWQPRGNGQVLIATDTTHLGQYIDQHFPAHATSTPRDGFGNLRRYRDSKAAYKATEQVVLLRGFGPIVLNGQSVDLGAYTAQFGCFAALTPRLEAERVCLVENLDCFLRAEEILGEETVFLHPYGRLGKDSLPDLQANTLLHFGDYDFTGLDEYLRLRAQYPHARLYLPANLEALWQNYAKPLKSGAVPSKRVQASNLPEVKRLRVLLSTTHRFLEQQALFPHEKPEL